MFAGFAATVFLVACQSQPAKLIATSAGYRLPETVLHDVANDRYLVSCMNGNPTAHDNNGEVRIINPDKPQTSRPFIAGGKSGVMLHGPKGMAIRDGILWVADIDILRSFDCKTGRPLRTIDLRTAGAMALNDVAIDEQGTIYLSEPRLVFDSEGNSKHVGVDRIFSVSAKAKVSILFEGSQLSEPNGLAWSPKHKRLLIAPLKGRHILAIDKASKRLRKLGAGSGRFDGIELLSDGSILVSCLGAGTVEYVGRPAAAPLVANRTFPGNFGIDRKRNLLLVPLIADGKVEIWKLRNRSSGR